MQADSLVKDGKFQEALDGYEDLLKKGDHLYSPEQKITIFIGRGNALQGLGKQKDAIQDYTKALSINKDIGEAYANRGIALDNLGDYEKAMEDYKKALSIKSELGDGPGIISRILDDPDKTKTIKDRLGFLEGFMEAHEAGIDAPVKDISDTGKKSM